MSHTVYMLLTAIIILIEIVLNNTVSNGHKTKLGLQLQQCKLMKLNH